MQRLTPTTTTAKSSATVTTVTKIITRASDLGTLVNSLNEFHAKVPITTINTFHQQELQLELGSIKKEPYNIKKVKKCCNRGRQP